MYEPFCSSQRISPPYSTLSLELGTRALSNALTARALSNALTAALSRVQKLLSWVAVPTAPSPRTMPVAPTPSNESEGGVRAHTQIVGSSAIWQRVDSA